MRSASTIALLAIVLLLDTPTFAQSIGDIDQGEQEAIDHAKQVSAVDSNIDDDPQGPFCATAGRTMSLLGVPYLGRPNVHGTVMALADSNPLRVTLTKKEQAIRDLDQQQATDMKSFPGGGSYSWDATVASLLDSVEWYSNQVAGREENIAKLKKNKEDIHSADPNASLASLDSAIADNQKELGIAQAHLADAQTRLPIAEAGFAKYTAAAARANLAKAIAERAAIAAAAACP